MHSCSTDICKLKASGAAAPPSALPHFRHDHQLNVADIDTTGFTSNQRHAGNTDVLDIFNRADYYTSAHAACADTDTYARELPCINHVKTYTQTKMLAQIIADNLHTEGQSRSIVPAKKEDNMEACVHAHSYHAHAQAQTAPYIDMCMHAQAASAFREQRAHDLHVQRMYDQYSNAEEVEYMRSVQSCLPPMSGTLIECIEGARARAARYTQVWTVMQLMSTVSQIMGVVLVLGLCSKEEVQLVRRGASPLPAWAMGYALGCLASLPLRVEEHKTHENLREVGREEGVARRLRRCVDFFFGIWFVLGVVWIFGRPSGCARASPKLYSLCVTLIMLSGLRYMVPLILCCALCCCLQPTTSSISSECYQGHGGKKGATQKQIDTTLPIFIFKQRMLFTNHSHKETLPLAPIAFVENNRHKHGKEYCCICLKKYKENAKLRGLPCSHHFHVDCVDTWLKINSSCPLCKLAIEEKQNHPFPFFWK